MKNLILLLFAASISGCNWNRTVFTIKVQYCNEVNFQRDSIFEVISNRQGDLPVIETYRQAMPVIYINPSSGNNQKIVNVCDFKIISSRKLK